MLTVHRGDTFKLSASLELKKLLREAPKRRLLQICLFNWLFWGVFLEKIAPLPLQVALSETQRKCGAARRREESDSSSSAPVSIIALHKWTAVPLSPNKSHSSCPAKKEGAENGLSLLIHPFVSGVVV